MIGVLSDEAGVRSLTTYKNTENASSTVMLSDIFSSVSGGSQYTYRWLTGKNRFGAVWRKKGYPNENSNVKFSAITNEII